MLLLFSIGMGSGQLLFKYSAVRHASSPEAPPLSRLFALALDWPFVLGIFLYVALTAYWIWLLTFLPLSRAYPFTIVSIVVAALGSSWLFDEHLGPSFFIGFLMIAIGLLFVSAE
jgi:drug/metabolite transporter (DMT)-like permease